MLLQDWIYPPNFSLPTKESESSVPCSRDKERDTPMTRESGVGTTQITELLSKFKKRRRGIQFLPYSAVLLFICYRTFNCWLLRRIFSFFRCFNAIFSESTCKTVIKQTTLNKYRKPNCDEFCCQPDWPYLYFALVYLSGFMKRSKRKSKTKLLSKNARSSSVLGIQVHRELSWQFHVFHHFPFIYPHWTIPS